MIDCCPNPIDYPSIVMLHYDACNENTVIVEIYRLSPSTVLIFFLCLNNILGAVSIMTSVVKKEGVKALYAGLSASILRQAIYGTARLGMHRSFSDYLEVINGGPIPFWQKVCSRLFFILLSLVWWVVSIRLL